MLFLVLYLAKLVFLGLFLLPQLQLTGLHGRLGLLDFLLELFDISIFLLRFMLGPVSFHFDLSYVSLGFTQLTLKLLGLLP